MRGKHIDRGRIRIKRGARVYAYTPIGGAKVILPTGVDMDYSEERDSGAATVSHPTKGALYMNKSASQYKSIDVRMFSRTDWMREKGKEGVRLGGRYADSFYGSGAESKPFGCKKLWSEQ